MKNYSAKTKQEKIETLKIKIEQCKKEIENEKVKIETIQKRLEKNTFYSNIHCMDLLIEIGNIANSLKCHYDILKSLENKLSFIDNLKADKKIILFSNIYEISKEIRMRQKITYGVDYRFCNDHVFRFEKLENKEYPIRTIEYNIINGKKEIFSIYDSHMLFAQNLIDRKYNILIALID